MTQYNDAPLISFGTRVRKSPYFAATLRWGCKAYTVYNRMYMPVYYESLQADYRRLVEDVTLWDVAGERQVEITGPDAARFVQYLTPRNLTDCAVGQCKYVLLTAGDGGIVNDPVLLRLGETHFWLSLADSDVLLWAKGVALDRDFDVTLSEPDVSPLQLQGPKSAAVMADLFGDGIGELRYFRFVERELDGIPLVVSRTGWSGEKGYELFLRDGSQGDRLWERVMAAGKPHAIAPAAPSQIRRIEAGMLSYGSDMGLTENPFELGLDRLVDLEQEADFIGKTALRKIAREGVTRRLVGLEIGGAAMVDFVGDHWPVLAGGETVGRVTSSVYSPRLGKNIGLALVAADQAALGTQLRLQAPHGMIDATVAPLPFFDPKKAITKG